MVRYIGALLLAALVLWSGEALAACAWVLWLDDAYVQSDGQSSLAPMVAYESKAECEEEAKRSNDRIGVTAERLRTVPRGQIGRTFYQCWPDTVDPRVPKGAQ